MFNFLIRSIIVLTIFHPGNLFAMLEADTEDIKLSKKRFLISGAPYDENNRSTAQTQTPPQGPQNDTVINLPRFGVAVEQEGEELHDLESHLAFGDQADGDFPSNSNKRNGAMTLFFKTVESKFGPNYEDAALVFEAFLPALPNDVSVVMIHYGGDPDCCCGKNKHPIINGPEQTLMYVYRAKKTNQVTGEVTYCPATYTRYASWVLPNENLIRSIKRAANDGDAHNANPALFSSYTSIDYVMRIMKEAGLMEVNFGWWRANSDNLKSLVDQYITPRPDYKQYEKITLTTI